MRSLALSLRSSLRRLALAAAPLCLASVLHAQAPLQEWTFDTPGAGTLASFGWSGWGALGNEAAVNYSGTLSFHSTQPRLGRIKNIKGVDGTTVLAASSGSGEVAKNRFVATVAFQKLSLSDDRLGTVSWSQATTSPDGAVRLLVRANDKWYASARSFKNPTVSGVTVVTNAEIFSLDLAGPEGLGSTRWFPITFGDHQPIDRAAALVAQPLGRTITGVGFLVEFTGTHDRRVYIDNVIISTSIP